MKLVREELRFIRSVALANHGAAFDLILSAAERALSDSDGTATAAANEDLPVPQDCQARAEGIAQTPHRNQGKLHD